MLGSHQSFIARALALCCLVQLAVSSPTLINCPRGSYVKDTYIKAGTTARCTCSDTSSNRDYSLIWENRPGNILSFTAGNTYSEAEQTYKCLIHRPDGTTETGLEYTPSVAYPPSSVQINVAKNSFNLCPSQNDKMTFSCNADVMPPPGVFSLKANGTSLANDWSTSFRPSAAGNMTLTCRVENPKFNDLFNEKSKDVIVREPPTEAPEISYKGKIFRNGDTATLPEGGIRLTCQVRGGYPEVERTNLTCENNSRGTPGSSTELDFTLSRVHKTCTCSAAHASNCYDKEAKITLNVTYVEITSFTVNGQNVLDVEIKAGERVQFLCQVESNPNTGKTIRHVRTDEELKSSSFIATCRHTGLWRCEAGNITKDITLKVPCPIQLKEPQKNSIKIKESQQDVYTQKISLFGYPRPNSYVYELKAQDPCDENKLKAINESFYTIDKKPDLFDNYAIDLDVSLKLKDLASSNYKVYKLVVGNDVAAKPIVTITLDDVNEASCDEPPIGLIIGIVVAVVIATVAIIIGVICYRRRRKSHRSSSGPNSAVGPRQSGPYHVPDTTRPPSVNVYVSPPASTPGHLTSGNPTSTANTDVDPKEGQQNTEDSASQISDPKHEAINERSMSSPQTESQRPKENPPSDKEAERGNPARALYESVHLNPDVLSASQVKQPSAQNETRKSRVPDLPTEDGNSTELQEYEDDPYIYDVPRASAGSVKFNRPASKKAESQEPGDDTDKNNPPPMPLKKGTKTPSAYVNFQPNKNLPTEDYDVLPFPPKPVKPKSLKVPPVPQENDLSKDPKPEDYDHVTFPPKPVKPKSLKVPPVPQENDLSKDPEPEDYDHVAFPPKPVKSKSLKVPPVPQENDLSKDPEPEDYDHVAFPPKPVKPKPLRVPPVPQENDLSKDPEPEDYDNVAFPPKAVKPKPLRVPPVPQENDLSKDHVPKDSDRLAFPPKPIKPKPSKKDTVTNTVTTSDVRESIGGASDNEAPKPVNEDALSEDSIDINKNSK